MNVVHGSDSPDNAAIELKRFFSDSEFFEEESDDEDKPAVQIMKERVYGERRSTGSRADRSAWATRSARTSSRFCRILMMNEHGRMGCLRRP